MNEEKIYIHWMYLIKETSINWETKFFAKQLLDTELREELMYWWSEVKDTKNSETPLTLEDVKWMLL